MVTSFILNKFGCRFTELQSGIANEGRRHGEMLHSIELSHKEKSHAFDTELARFNGLLIESVEELNRRLAKCEMNLKEEIVAKFTRLEKVGFESLLYGRLYNRDSSCVYFTTTVATLNLLGTHWVGDRSFIYLAPSLNLAYAVSSLAREACQLLPQRRASPQFCLPVE